LWLRNGREFLYDIDASHAAVFSLSTMSFALLADPGLGGRQMIAEKSVSSQSALVALLLVNENAEWATAIYEGTSLEHRRTLLVPGGRHIQFDTASDDIFVSNNQSPSASTMTRLDWRAAKSVNVGFHPELEVLAVRTTSDASVILARNYSSDVWLEEGPKRRRLTTDGVNYSAALSAGGEVLLSKQSRDGNSRIWLVKTDGTSRPLTNGPNDTTPDFGPDGRQWAYVDYANKSVMLCQENTECRILKRDEFLPAWPRFSPTGESLAYVTQMGTPRLTVVSLKDDRVVPIGPMYPQCPPVWSSASTLWSLEGAAQRRVWLERDASTGSLTGNRIDLPESGAVGERCWPVVSDSKSPFFRHVQVEVEERSQLLRLMPQ
jgi:hypothetical protein